MTTPLDQVPAAVRRIQREIVLARFIGKLAVDQGLREVRRRVDTITSTSPPDATVAPGVTIPPAPTESEPVVDAASLALADYDHLPATDIVSKLAGLDQDERNRIEAYERRHRHRSTVLGKLDQLRAAGE
jgi:hypothetical protein